MSTFTPNLKLEKPDGTDYVNIGALNSNMDKLDIFGIDYQIERGTYEKGKWIKWASGKSEYIGTVQVMPQSWFAWGSIVQSRSFEVRFPSGLFVEPPDFFACIKGTPYRDGGSCLGVVTNVYETVTGQGDMFLYRPNIGGKEPSDVSFKAIGRWK